MKNTKSFLYEIDVLTIVSSNLNCIQIQLKTNGMQNDEKRFKIFLWIWCWILLFLKTPFHAFLIESGLNKSPVWQFMKPKVLLPKLTSMNHCHWNLSFMLLCTTCDDQIINYWKKIDLVKIKFHLNENI
jgi:hypothetical protein